MKFLSILLCSLFFYLNSVFAQNKNFIPFNYITHFSVLGEIKKDTIIFLYSGENKKLKDFGREIIFGIKKTNKFIILSEHSFEDILTIKYIAYDFDQDDVKEVIVIPMDEAYYDVYVFKILDKRSFKIKKMFLIGNLWCPQQSDISIYKIERDTHNNILNIIFYSENEDGKIIAHKLYFLKEKKKFVLEE